ncbi:guanine nucleotide-binding protein-like 3 homolog [Nephila pilipes]|uniref:Guanine nucleotide-binding protein-like 3 homolog n=1 Tax=Nephila pilipes TaxID=299642 RepID=A0A8X6ID06_NEPPI|nr:guanine nucleotide-binding protein-like 3 homolog [Nephila pilipes]GFT48123.1 guanine nucleotide-binding protein-like 3 homolog [Nephila pilipes]GFU04372.1 guanine nucleotide-binding protein-like 3 homolog [Nephila pilipes]GFU10316.1 guanine nucleotide-binding protein-like 3 homolog [Nephila pilipes]
MPKKSKKQSKRMTCSKRFKIKKKVAEHNRKKRKEAKKMDHKKKAHKDLGVPNSFPFKEDILLEAEKRKQIALDLKEAQKASRLKLQMENRGLDQLVNNANRMDAEFEKTRVTRESQPKENAVNGKTYVKELKSVIENSDVILEVLDARDPLGSRSPQIEELVINSGKKLVLVLNKIDLIPRKNLNEWLTYLRKSLPTVAFKASTQSQNTNLSRSKIPAIKLNENFQSSSPCFGASFLMKVLGNYCRNQNIQTFIKVGVVGFPNVGKSSVINSLKRSRSCNVGATPGLTKTVQEVSLDKHIKILDSPGVVLAKSDSADLALRNVLKVEKLKDVITPAEAILKRADHVQLCLHYTIPEFSSSEELFCNLAKRMGRYKKGGIPNMEEGAKRLINDWNKGIIKYYTHPPEEHQQSTYISAAIVSDFAKAFDISAMEENMELDKAPELFPGQGVLAESAGTAQIDISEVAEEDTMETDCADSERKITVNFDSKKGNKDSDLEPKYLLDEHQQNKVVKKNYKKMKKNKKRLKKAALKLSESLEGALTI